MTNELNVDELVHPGTTPFPSPVPSVDAVAHPPRDGLSNEQWEVVEFCVRLARLFGIPKSVGEIFGFVFCSPSPVTFENIVSGLGVSAGSASHGLRFLRQLGALKLTYVARDRRDFYVAETSARRLFAGFLSENVLHEANENWQHLTQLHARIHADDRFHASDLAGRVEVLMDWSNQGSMALKAVMAVLGE